MKKRQDGIASRPALCGAHLRTRTAPVTKERAKTKSTFTGPVFGLLALLVADAALGQAGGSNAMEKGMEIRILIEGTALAATLEDNAASRDFVAQLPLDLTLEDYNATEKIADLPSRLSTEGTPEGVDPDVGDVTYFAPWGNLALFYRDFRYSRGLIRLGRIDGDLKLLERDGSIAVRIEHVQRQG